MEKTPDTIIVPSDANPTLANGAALDDALVGSILSGNSLTGMVSGGIIGGLAGGGLGKLEMEKEYREGRTVKKPFSKKFMVSLNAVIGAAAAITFTAITIGTAAMTWPVGLAAVAVGSLGGAWSGNMGYNAQERQYEAAQNYYVQHGGNYRGREREAQAKIQITAEENAMLKGRLAEAHERSYSERAATQQPSTSQQR